MRSGLHPGAHRRALRLATALLLVLAALPLPAAAAEPTVDPRTDPTGVDAFAPYVALEEGHSGPAVSRLQSELRDAGFYRGEISGDYDRVTREAVVAFQKYIDAERSGSFRALDWVDLIDLPTADIPYRWNEPDRVEIDTTRQLLYVVRDHQVVGILPTSTGSGQTYFSIRQGREVRSTTPHGDFELYWRQYGWNCDETTGWCVYNYWGFTPYYGIHGYRNVPSYPASHGCSRVHLWDSDWLDDHLFIGMPVHIWRTRPAATVPPVPEAIVGPF